jgi:hypothetical protein
MSAPTELSINAPTQLVGAVPATQLPKATATVPGAVLPDGASISLNLTTGKIATIGLSVTIVTAQLTTLGTQGSMTFTAGLLTAQTPAT